MQGWTVAEKLQNNDPKITSKQRGKYMTLRNLYRTPMKYSVMRSRNCSKNWNIRNEFSGKLNERIDKERTSELKDKSLEIFSKKKKEIRKNKNGVIDWWDSIKKPNICVLGLLESV